MPTENILIDTTYLLPLFGIDLQQFQKKDLEKLLDSKINIWFNPISLIEAKWVIYKIAKKDQVLLNSLREIYNETIDNLISGYNIKPTPLINSEIDNLENLLYDHGIKDFFDRIIASTAKIVTGVLLTEDKELRTVLVKIREFKDLKILSWKELVKQL
ncbi:MAG: PIN domain-containing protein [Candidatus Njordarchaeia archaeon]